MPAPPPALAPRVAPTAGSTQASVTSPPAPVAAPVEPARTPPSAEQSEKIWFDAPLLDRGSSTSFGSSRGPSTDRRTRSNEITRSAPAASAGLGSSVCVFWLNDRRFALETGAVSEVVVAEQVAPVPLAPPGVLGLFNLRGTPVTVVDLAAVLGLPARERRADDRGSAPALVLRVQSMVIAARVHSVDLVLPAGRGVFIAVEDASEHPVVKGLLELDADQQQTVTVLDPLALARCFEKLKFR